MHGAGVLASKLQVPAGSLQSSCTPRKLSLPSCKLRWSACMKPKSADDADMCTYSRVVNTGMLFFLCLSLFAYAIRQKVHSTCKALFAFHNRSCRKSALDWRGSSVSGRSVGYPCKHREAPMLLMPRVASSHALTRLMSTWRL
jgi:hypothetical protein